MTKYIKSKDLSPEALQVRRSKDAHRKRRQCLKETNETLEQTHKRRRFALQQRQQSALINLNRKHEQQKEIIRQRQELQTKNLRRGPKFNERTDKALIDRHLIQHQKLQAKYSKDLTLKRQLHKNQIEAQRTLQRTQRPERDEPFTIERTGFKFNKRFNMFLDTFRVAISHPPVEPVDVFVQTLLGVVEERSLVQGDYIRLIVDHLSWTKPFSTKKSIIQSDQRQFFASVINEVLEHVEYKSAPLNEIVIEVQSAKVPRGQGRLQVTKHNLKLKKSLITIRNDDSLCLARAVVTALANINKSKWTKSQLKHGFNESRKLQGQEAEKLHLEAQVVPNEYGGTLSDVDEFAKHLGIQINIVDGERFNEIIHTTSNSFENGMIYLYKSKNHFDVISSMPGFLSKDYYCHSCKKSYTHRDKHRCLAKCVACFKYGGGCNKSTNKVTCSDCNRQFFGEACYNEHKRDRATNGKEDVVCNHVQKCLLCKRTVTDLKTHVCGFSNCGNCEEYCDQATHKCFMSRKPSKGGDCMVDCATTGRKCMSCRTRSPKYMFYDFETTQDTGVHIVNWVHAWDFNNEEHTFDNIDSFCKFVFEGDTCKNYTFIAHNAKAFDSQFVLKYCIESGLKPYTINNGTKIVYMSAMKRTFIDSINFVSGRLANFPKTFGFKELKKGYFPHYFNTPENQNYVGPIPEKEYYSPDQMSPTDREAFLEWYQTKVDGFYTFDFAKELREYCRSDVDILRRSMMQFRANFIEKGNLDPFRYVTIASVCMAIFRSSSMPLKQIAVVKDTKRVENFSEISIK